MQNKKKPCFEKRPVIFAEVLKEVLTLISEGEGGPAALQKAAKKYHIRHMDAFEERIIAHFMMMEEIKEALEECSYSPREAETLITLFLVNLMEEDQEYRYSDQGIGTFYA